jgi:tRNA threonylcarbamoyladenosine biosynthesis protein TsaB
MTILALETTTDRLAVAARRRADPAAGPAGGPREAERTLDGARRHAAQLFPLMDEVLAELDLSLDEVEALILADGPGSFTGLRVGAAAAKALVRTCPRLTLWTASTLMARAAGAKVPRGARVLVVTSALRGELYAASYRLDLPNTVETVMAPVVTTPDSLLRETPDLLVADAPDPLVARLADRLAVPLVRGAPARPSAVALAALVGVPGGARPVEDVDGWEPLYGRPAEAQVRWESAHGRVLSDPPRRPR